MKRTPLKRGKPLRAKTRMKQRSDKRKAYIASTEFQDALAYMHQVKECDCVACGAQGPTEAHHCTGDGMARNDWHTIPLCTLCHLRYHARKRTWEAEHGKDYSYIEQTQTAILGAVRCDTLSALRKLAAEVD